MESSEQLRDNSNQNGLILETKEPDKKIIPSEVTKSEKIRLLLPIIIMLFIIVVTWATPNVVGRYLTSNDLLTPTQISALRYIPASITLLIFCFITKRGKLLIAVLKEKYIHLLIASIILTSFVLFQMFSVKYTTASASSFLLNVNPVITFVLSIIILKERHKWWGGIGVAIASIGIFFIAIPLDNISQLFNSANILGNFLAFLSGVAWAFYSIYLKRFLKEKDPIVTSTWNLTFSAIILTVVMFAVDGWFSTNPGINAFLLTTFLGIVPTAISFTLWFETIRRISVQKASVFQFLIPIFATLLAILFLQETIDWQFGLGAGLILIGLVVTQTS
ncbi:MAG TPA: DMT family transporter [candidate division Zixibacteria bacterium]|nr:DMT family transporter [candidate division Zixibacteria bacterium]